MKKIAIVGAGPTGLFAAHKLAGKADITIFDRGKKVKDRKCPSKDKCIECKVCDKSSGVAGGGAFSDGKFIFETLIGNRAVGSNLYEIVGQEREQEYLKAARSILEEYLEEKIQMPSEEKMNRAKEVSKIAAINDMDYLFALQTHIGTDKLPELMGRIEADLIKKGVKFETQKRIDGFNEQTVYTKKEDYKYDYLIVAPGRRGSVWLEKMLKENQIYFQHRTIDIGFRIETDAEILSDLTDLCRDVKLSFRRPNGDELRTFCVCPNGSVTRETYEDGFNLVNGASDSTHDTSNTNFALLVNMPLRNNARSNSYGQQIAKTYYELGTKKPNLQRLGDLRMDRSSKAHQVPEWRVQPTLKDVNIGDVGGGMPYRIERDLLWGIEKLSVPGLMEGLNQDSTLIYAPEIKFHGLKVETNGYLRCKKNIYVAGDGAGVSRGIGGAAASGILAAEGILKNL